MKQIGDQFLTTNDLSEAFGCSIMTINNWRKGSKRISPLPHYFAEAGTKWRVLFKLSDVQDWAKLHNLKPKIDLRKIANKRTVEEFENLHN